MNSTLSKWPGPIFTISIAQLLATSLWFSVNAVSDDLIILWGVGAQDIAILTGAVQIGFIVGTITFAFTGIADKFATSSLFALSALSGAIFNLLFCYHAESLTQGIALRFIVGISMAGVYPIGMKLMVQWVPERSSWGLSILVAMLTLGTALPQLSNFLHYGSDWRAVILLSSVFALLGSALVYLLGNPKTTTNERGAVSRKGPSVAALIAAFQNKEFRSAAIGYFGHMWELYAFWALIPTMIASHSLAESKNISLLSFFSIGIGALGCVAGGILARKYSPHWVAIISLRVSLSCCLVYGVVHEAMPGSVAMMLFIVWGFTVVSDSPQFSAICATSCPPALVGSALSALNAFGFSITVISIISVTIAFGYFGGYAALILAIGPLIGLRAMRARSA